MVIDKERSEENLRIRRAIGEKLREIVDGQVVYRDLGRLVYSSLGFGKKSTGVTYITAIFSGYHPQGHHYGRDLTNLDLERLAIVLKAFRIPKSDSLVLDISRAYPPFRQMLDGVREESLSPFNDYESFLRLSRKVADKEGLSLVPKKEKLRKSFRDSPPAKRQAILRKLELAMMTE